MAIAPDSIRLFIAEFGAMQSSYVKSLVDATGQVVSDERLGVLSRIFAFEILQRHTMFMGLAMDKSDQAKETLQASEWFSKFAPESFRLMAKRIRLGAKESLELHELMQQMEALCNSAYPEAQKRLLILLGLKGEDLDLMFQRFQAAEFVALGTILNARMQRR
jgi:lysyl-tRNA synthetase class I